MLCACHSLHQNLYAWTRIGSRGSIGVQVIPLNRDLDACSRLMRWPGLSPAGATWVGRVRHSQDFTLRPNTQARIFRIASMAEVY